MLWNKWDLSYRPSPAPWWPRRSPCSREREGRPSTGTGPQSEFAFIIIFSLQHHLHAKSYRYLGTGREKSKLPSIFCWDVGLKHSSLHVFITQTTISIKSIVMDFDPHKFAKIWLLWTRIQLPLINRRKFNLFRTYLWSPTTEQKDW